MNLLFLVTLLAIDPEGQKAIDYGKTFKSEVQFMDKAIRSKRIKMAANIPFMGSTKHLILLTELDLISAQAAKAKREFRELSEEQSKIESPGSIVARVEKFEESGGEKLENRYVNASPHMVLQVDGDTTEPDQDG